LLNSLVVPFNAINALGPRGGGVLFTRSALENVYDGVHTLLVKWIQRLSDEELARGMYYPSTWDPLFGDYMTLAEILRFPMVHFYFHVNQIVRSSRQ
jgi:hypothetical protein